MQPRCSQCLPGLIMMIMMKVEVVMIVTMMIEMMINPGARTAFLTVRARYTQVLCRQLLFVGQLTINSHDDDDNADDDDDDKYQV